MSDAGQEFAAAGDEIKGRAGSIPRVRRLEESEARVDQETGQEPIMSHPNMQSVMDRINSLRRMISCLDRSKALHSLYIKRHEAHIAALNDLLLRAKGTLCENIVAEMATIELQHNPPPVML